MPDPVDAGNPVRLISPFHLITSVGWGAQVALAELKSDATDLTIRRKDHDSTSVPLDGDYDPPYPEDSHIHYDPPSEPGKFDKKQYTKTGLYYASHKIIRKPGTVVKEEQFAWFDYVLSATNPIVTDPEHPPIDYENMTPEQVYPGFSLTYTATRIFYQPQPPDPQHIPYVKQFRYKYLEPQRSGTSQSVDYVLVNFSIAKTVEVVQRGKESNTHTTVSTIHSINNPWTEHIPPSGDGVSHIAVSDPNLKDEHGVVATFGSSTEWLTGEPFPKPQGNNSEVKVERWNGGDFYLEADQSVTNRDGTSAWKTEKAFADDNAVKVIQTLNANGESTET